MTSHRSPVLVPYLIAALRANAPLPENGDALARLQERVAAAALPPGPSPVRPLPPRAIFENDGLTLEVEDPTGYFGQVISGRATDGD